MLPCPEDSSKARTLTSFFLLQSPAYSHLGSRTKPISLLLGSDRRADPPIRSNTPPAQKDNHPILSARLLPDHQADKNQNDKLARAHPHIRARGRKSGLSPPPCFLGPRRSL